MANRFYTLMIVPEKTAQVRRIVIPAWVLRGALIGLLLLGVLAGIMLLDYWYVMGQIDENKQLKIESRRLRQQVQIYRNKMDQLDRTMDRLQTFSTRLKVITNIEDRDNQFQSLNQALPDASSNVGAPKRTETAEFDPEAILLREDEEKLNQSFLDLNQRSIHLEQNLNELYELLVDQKAFLAALPTRRPAGGVFTAGFGIRKSPFGDRDKMHEGLDIANGTGTHIFSTAHGIVTFAGQKPGYGRIVIIDHGFGLETWYGHTNKVLVKSGERVRRGQLVAYMGSTGRSTGPHVHYEVRVNGIPVDPLTYILEN